MKREVLIAIAILINIHVSAQGNFNPYPKKLKKELYKITGIKDVKLEKVDVGAGMRDVLPGSFFKLPAGVSNKEVEYVYVGRVNSCRAGGCSVAGNNQPDFDSEYFDYFIFFDYGGVVKNVTVYNYQATHGQEITVKGWLKQFREYDISRELEVGKNVDAIAGATVSVYAITADVKHRTAVLKEILKENN